MNNYTKLVAAIGLSVVFFGCNTQLAKALNHCDTEFFIQFLREAVQLPAPLLTLDAANPEKEPLKHLLIGSPQAVTSGIHALHARGYADVGVWSPLLPTAKSGEVMSIFVKYLRI